MLLTRQGCVCIIGASMMNANDIELLHAEQLITDEQRDAIMARFFQKSAPTVPVPHRALLYVLSTVAALLIVSGAIVQAVARWQSITPLMKSVAAMLIMVAAWLGYYLLRNRKPLVAEAMAFIGAGMWGANILLHEALFELDAPGVELLFLFIVGVLPVPFLLRQRVLVGVVALCTVIFASCLATAPASSWLAVPGLASAPGTDWSLVMSVILIWWMVGERCRCSSGVCRGYYWISFPAYVGFLFSVQHILLYGTTSMQTAPYNWCIYALPTIFAFLLKPKGMRWRHWLPATLGSVALLPLAVYLPWHSVYRAVWGMFAAAAFSGLFMVLCVRSGRLYWGAIAMGMVFFILVDVLVHIYRSLSDSGLFLMATGLAVLVFAFVLEKQRSYLIRKAKADSAAADAKALPPIPQA